MMVSVTPSRFLDSPNRRPRYSEGDVFLIDGVDADHRATDILPA